MSLIRLLARLSGFAITLAVTALIAALLTLFEKFSGRRVNRAPWARFCFYLSARSLGFGMDYSGEVARGPVLFVSNHISWSDIPILGGRTPLRFLSKQEVRSWPIIGWLAAQAGTLFIRRGGGKAARSRQEITRALEGGESVLVFPEGTTSAGIGVLPFHGRLLQAAVDANVNIQPISIAYLRNDKPDAIAPFIGDDEFQNHLIRLLRLPATRVRVHFHDAVSVGPEETLASLSARLRSQVAAGLADLQKSGDQPASPLNEGPEFS